MTGELVTITRERLNELLQAEAELEQGRELERPSDEPQTPTLADRFNSFRAKLAQRDQERRSG